MFTRNRRIQPVINNFQIGGNSFCKPKTLRHFLIKRKSDKLAKNISSPLIFVLNCTGISFFDKNGGLDGNRLNFKIIFALFGLHLCLLHNLGNSIFFAYKQRQISKVFTNLGGLLRAVSSVVAFDMLFYNKKAYVDILTDLCQFEKPGFSYVNVFETRFKRWCQYVVSGFLVCFAVKLFLPLAFINGMDLEMSIEMFMYDFQFLHDLSPANQKVFWCCEIVAYETFTGFRFFIQLTLICYVKLLSSRIKQLIGKTRNCNYNYREILQVCEEHTRLFHLVRRLDKYFGFMIFVWLFEWVSTIVFNLPGTLTSMSRGSNWFLLVASLLEVTTTLAESVICSLAIASVGSGQEELLQVAHSIVGRSRVNLEAELLSTFMLTKFTCSSLYLSMFRCVSFTKTLILNVFGAAITYATFIGQELEKDTF